MFILKCWENKAERGAISPVAPDCLAVLSLPVSLDCVPLYC